MKLHILERDSEQEAPFYVTDVLSIQLQSIYYLLGKWGEKKKTQKTPAMIRPELEFPN